MTHNYSGGKNKSCQYWGLNPGHSLCKPSLFIINKTVAGNFLVIIEKCGNIGNGKRLALTVKMFCLGYSQETPRTAAARVVYVL